ncbi:hypothetical protein F5890DRAFT_1645689 [Lentinula detonsa]|uniref:Uncharacterized protein n=1 Tax=Lentinula detonsa TaxID=2804962 RepID=A0AA38PNU6_9AGAR|nr:hypothetical protein F5890DRAFT_1645689 [Lentinula detonsa]
MDVVITEDTLWMITNYAGISAIRNETNEQLVIDILEQITSQGSSSAGTQFQSFSACLINVPQADSNVYYHMTPDSHLRVVLVSAVTEAILTELTVKDQNQTAILISDIFSPFFNFLPNILISRLMLNLRSFHTSGTGDTLTTSQRAQFSSLHFASNQMLGNIGAPLDGGSFNEEEEEEEEELNEVEIGMETIREERQSLEV